MGPPEGVTRVFRTGRLAAASPDEAALRVRELYPDAIRVVLMPSPEPGRPYEYLVELKGDEEVHQTISIVLAFLAAVVQRFLTRVAQELWDQLWTQIFAAVAEAEQRWVEAGQGAQKRDWAVNTVMTAIEEKITSLGWIQRMILRLFIGEVVDAIIATVNDELGHDWVEKVKQVERELAAKLPIIE